VSYLYPSNTTTEKGADALSGQPVNIPRDQAFGATKLSYVGVSASKVPYFFATKILHIIRCLFLQLLLTSFTIFSRSHLLC